MAGIIDNLNFNQQMQLIYIGYFNRSADTAGFNFWGGQNQMAQAGGQSASVALTNIANSFRPQPETIALYPVLGSTTFNPADPATQSQVGTLVNAIYLNLFGRAADAAGLSYWQTQIITGAVGVGASILAIANGALGTDSTLLQNKITVALDFTSRTGAAGQGLQVAPATPPASFLSAAKTVLSGVDGVTLNDASVTTGQTATTSYLAASVAGITITLTLNADNPVPSGNGGDVINAPLAFNAGTGTQLTTLQTGDVINETGANNTLNLTVGVNDATISGVTISGVQTFNITNSGFVGAQPILQGGGITGLVTVNNVNSTQAVQIGSAAAPLAAALSAIGVTGTAGTPNTTRTTAVIATAALAGAADALTVNATNAGSSTTTARVLAGPATGVNGYEMIAVAAVGANFVGLGNFVSGANTTTKVSVTGAGSVSLFGDGVANNFTSLATIDASAATGAVTITGASTAGAGIGLLTGDTAVKSVLGGTAGDSVDLSSMTLAQFNANTTSVDLGAGRDTLIVDNTIATTTAALARVSNVEILGVVNPGATASTVDFSKLPTGIDTFKLFGNQGANTIALINGPSTLTYDAGIFGGAAVLTTIAAAGIGTTDVLNLVVGSSTAGNALNEFYTTTGYETINVLSQGGTNSLFQIAATASAGGTVTLNISGTTNFSIIGPLTGPAIKGIDAVTITNSGLTTLATAGNTGSTDARTINAATSGGLVMGGAETGNTGVNGQSIIGSATAGKSNILIGSPGNDAITGGRASDVLVTDGGADTVTLGTHVSDRIEIYGVNNGATVQTLGSVQGALTGSIVDATEKAAGGFWGTTPGATPINIFTLFPGTTAANFGTSASQATVTSFITGATGDVLDFSLKSFTAAAGAHKGLTTVDGNTTAGAGASQLTTVSSGGSLSGTTADVVVIAGSTFASATQLAQALKTGSFGLSLSANPVAGNVSHLLFAYNDASGNGHIADVAFTQAATANRSFASLTNVAASDLVQLSGVSVSSLTTNNVNIVA